MLIEILQGNKFNKVLNIFLSKAINNSEVLKLLALKSSLFLLLRILMRSI